MRDALKTLPWVESDKPIDADAGTRQVKFFVKKPSDFDLKAVKEVLAKKGFDQVEVLAGPGKS